MERARLTVDEARNAAELGAVLLAADRRVRLVYLYGSTVAPSRGEVHDVDLAVASQPGIELDELMRLRADAVAAAAGVPLDVSALDQAGVVLTWEVAETGRCLFARGPDDEAAFVTRARARYWDFKPYLDEQWRLAGERIDERRRGPVTEAVRRRLRKLEEAVSRLEVLGRAGRTALRASFRDAWAAERGLQLAAGIPLDVGNHILSAHFGESARDYEDVDRQARDPRRHRRSGARAPRGDRPLPERAGARLPRDRFRPRARLSGSRAG